MIPAAFDYARPATLEAAVALAGEEGAALLAGGQSLITDLKLRRRRPRLLVDLGGLPDLAAIEIGRDGLRIGAMARQTAIVRAAGQWPLLARVAEAAADPMVRRRGTLVGAFCEADPGGDWAAAGLVLEPVLEIVGPQGDRSAPLTDFIQGPRQVALGRGEIVAGARFPTPPAGARSLYVKVKHPAVGWSVVSAAILLAPGHAPRIAASGAVGHPQRLSQLEAALARIDLHDAIAVDRALAVGLGGLSYRGDAYASESYRAGRLQVLLRRAIAELASTPALAA